MHHQMFGSALRQIEQQKQRSKERDEAQQRQEAREAQPRFPFVIQDGRERDL